MHDYKVFKLSQEPKLFGVSIFMVLPIIVMSVIGLAIRKLLPMTIIGFGLGGLLHAKFGIKGMKYFYSYIYWHLPKFITMLILPNSPDSANRIYRK